jgi:chromosome segregation ATPase
MMTTATAIQENITTLRGKIEAFETQLATLREEIEGTRTAAGTAMLENKSTEVVEADLLRQESRLRTLESAKAAAQTKLSEATENLKLAQVEAARERVREIRRELDRVGEDLENDLTKALDSAVVFESLISEGWTLNRTLAVSPGALGTWLDHSNTQNQSYHVDVILGKVLKRFSEFKPKGNA